MKLFNNKRGDMVLRDIIFMIIIFSGIIALSSVFVQEMGDTYSNENMTSSYNEDLIGSSQLNKTATEWQEIGEGLDGSLLQMVGAVLTGAVDILQEVLKAPITFKNMLMSILTSFGADFGEDSPLTNIIGFIIVASLYILIIFVIISAFLKGGKL